MSNAKKKLFIPRRQSGENSRWNQWNKEQPIKDGVRINQYDEDGLKQGYWEYYYSNGDIYYKGSYKDGEMDGYWEEYYDNGNVWVKGSFKDGKEDGIWELYYKNGNLHRKDLYENGKLIKELPLTESEQQKKKLFIPRKQSGPESKWNTWNKEQPIKNIDGKEIRINQYNIDTGLKEGYWEEYHPENNQLFRNGWFKDNKENGVWESYYINGQLHTKGEYKNGLRDGIWFIYDITGKLKTKGEYDMGKIIKVAKPYSITESEQQKKKLFIPRKIDERLVDWNNMQPIIDGEKINQYDLNTGNPTGRWGEGDIYMGDTRDLFETIYDVFADAFIDEDLGKDYVYDSLINRVKNDLYETLSGEGPLSPFHYDLTIPLDSEEVRKKFDRLYDEDGMKTGIWEWYYDNGNISSKGLYKDGKFNKKLPLTESEQPKKKLFIPRNVESRYDKWNEEQPIVDGKPINQFNKNGKKEGLWIEYLDGEIESKKEYRDGKQDGIYQTFHENGQIQFDGNMRNNEPDGLWRLYYKTGQLREIGGYYNGYKQGVWKWYYPFENQLESIVKYVDNKPDGLAMEYYGNGNIWKKEVYKLGKKIAYIEYRYDGNHSDSMNWNDEYENMIIKENIDNNHHFQIPEKDDILRAWSEYYGSSDTASWELDSYESDINNLIKNGGKIYRVLFVDNFSEINITNLGDHWTTSRNNAIDIAEINKSFYGSDKKYIIIIEAYVEPNNITINGVDIKGNPLEKEVNVKNNNIKVIGTYQLRGKDFIPIDINKKLKIKEEMNNKDKILKSFEPQRELNPKIWDEDGKLKKKIKDTLVAIGQEFHKTLEVEVPIDDIIFTGSLANYNWSEYSDVDLHVLMDFNEFDDKELIKKYFDAKKAIWNDSHNIKIKGYDVELYAQDVDEPHESTGIYSVMKDEWIKKPKPQDVAIDKETIKKKVRGFEASYIKIYNLFGDGEYDDAKKYLKLLKDKIKKYRKAGLDSKGEMSTENLVFKTLRRSGLMEKIINLGIDITDKEYTIETLDENEKKKLFIPRRLSGENSKWNQWNKEQPIKDGIQINQYTHDGIKTGIWEEYYDNGNIKSKGSYENGLKDGIWGLYWGNGNLWYKGTYKNGLMDGIWEDYYGNGNLYSKDLYKNGKYIKELPLTDKEYTIETLDENKKLFIPRRQSGENSKWNQWNKEQPIKSINGKDIRINQYTHDGIKTGLWEIYDGNGDIHSRGTYKNGLMDGIWEWFHENGNLWYKGLYKNDKREGIWEGYYENGEIDSKDLYKNGKYIKELPLDETENISEGKIGDNINKTLKAFKKTIGVDAGFLASFGAGINGGINNINSLIREYSFKDLNDFELTNLAIALIVVYLKNKNSLKNFKNELLSITAFSSLMPGYSDLINSLVGNVDFMDAFMTIIKSIGVYSMLSYFKEK